ncbi:MAG: HNH endonuclease, partial [Weeksellaceae bacterium]
VFDLSYDQFDKLKEIEVRKALERGADISELDTARIPKVINVQNETLGRQISQQVKDLVWNRDNGQCRECGSNEQLEFDHIIPFSKGGSNTYRSIQLLCQPCNRKKSNKIG